MTSAIGSTAAGNGIPPQDQHAEKCLIGSVMLYPEMLDEISSPPLSPVDFYNPANVNIWGAILDLYRDRKPIDPVAVADKLTSKGQNEPTTYDWLQECVESVPHGALAAHYAAIVDERCRRRLLIYAGTDAVKDAYTSTTDVEDAITKTSVALGAIIERSVSSKSETIAEIMIDSVKRLVEGRGMGLMSGFETIDKLTSGFQKGNLIIVAARPSVGKTAWAVNIGLNLCQRKKSVGMMSLEQSRHEIAERMLSAESRMSMEVLRSGNLTEAQTDSLMSAAARLGDFQFFIDECLNNSITAIEARARLLKRREDVEFLIVDYLQLVKGGSYKSVREQEVAEVSRRLKALAKSLDIPVMCLASMNRQSEQGGKPREPRMSDIRESGAIESDADLILLLHRPEMSDAGDEPNVMYVNLAKQRNGRVGQVKFMFDKSYMTFRDVGMRDDNRAPDSYSAY